MFQFFTPVGDPHITPKTLDKGEQLFDLVESIGFPVIWLGDFLDTKEVIRGKCLNLIYRRLSQSCLHHYIVVGNHDYFNLECQDHSLQVLKALPNVTIIDQPTVISNTTIAVPYIHDKSKIKELLAEFLAKGFKCVIGHFDISGFDYGNGHMCEDGLTLEDFDGFDLVISGHFHKFQRHSNGKLIYLGTPYSHSFGEANQDKNIGMFDAHNVKMELIPTNFPRHVSMKQDLSKRGAEKKIEAFIEENRTNLIRIQLAGAPEDVIKFDKSKWVDLNIKWEDKSEGTIEVDQDVDESLDNKSQFMTWARDIKNLDKETTNIGLAILEGLNVK